MQIESGLYHRKGRSDANFSRTLPAPQSELASEILKDPYNFDFLTLAADVRERDLHKGLLAHLREFLLELGMGFEFVGDQFHLEVANRDFYLDMLFYHLRLRCYVVIELKTREFLPEDAGKMNFYLSAVDDLLRPGTPAGSPVDRSPTATLPDPSLLLPKSGEVRAAVFLSLINTAVLTRCRRTHQDLPNRFNGFSPRLRI
jgi:predicted nuclease of restriction endonuclease-like (RecB) superfamily